MVFLWVIITLRRCASTIQRCHCAYLGVICARVFSPCCDVIFTRGPGCVIKDDSAPLSAGLSTARLGHLQNTTVTSYTTQQYIHAVQF